MTRHRAILIAGPTASGKSSAALALAQHIGGEIINADSMQVYSDLRILTARPGEEEERLVPHALYGFVAASQAYSAGRWLDDVKRQIGMAEAAGRVPIITGGTGLYFKLLLEGLSPIPDIPDEIRVHWRQQARELEPEGLHGVLKARDALMADRLRASDPQRIVRALEVLDATGESLAFWQDRPGEPVLSEAEVLRLYIEPPRDLLYARIDTRLDEMLEQGALEEVEALAKQDLDADLPVMRALGVRPLMAYLAGEMDRDAAVERTRTDTRRYAKRQLTWSRSNMIAWERIIAKDSESLTSKLFSIIDV